MPGAGPVWAEISLKAIIKNLRVIRRHVGPEAENSGGREVERVRPGRRADFEGAAEGGSGVVRSHVRE